MGRAIKVWLPAGHHLLFLHDIFLHCTDPKLREPVVSQLISLQTDFPPRAGGKTLVEAYFQPSYCTLSACATSPLDNWAISDAFPPTTLRHSCDPTLGDIEPASL